MAAGAAEIFTFDRSFDPAQLTARGVTIAVTDGALDIKSTVPASDSGVIFPLPEKGRDLSRFRFVEADVENTGDKPLRFTFWARSGHGWGGVSTFTPDGGPTAGREMLAPGQRGTFKIDLHTRYPGPDVYTPATNPASIRWLEFVVGDSRSTPSLRVRSLRATGEAPTGPTDISQRVLVPDITRDPPGPGRRVYQQLPGWEKTSVTHVLTLPREWKPGAKYPVIVEYTGNVFYHKFCHSTGYTDQGTMAYGLARGEKFITLNLPFISVDGQREQIDGWGDIAKTADYCVEAVRAVCEEFGGDAGAVFFVGFSRGEYAAALSAAGEILQADALQAEAEAALARLRDKTTGLYIVSPDLPYSLWMDNLEVWSALPSRALSQALLRHFWQPQAQRFRVSNQARHVERPDRFYPELTAQIFPLLLGWQPPDPALREALAPAALYARWMRAHRAQWLAQMDHDYPWGLLALLAWQQGDLQTVRCWQQRTVHLRHGARWTVTDEVVAQLLPPPEFSPTTPKDCQ